MLVSLKHRLVLLAMPKCASTSLESALSGNVDVVISRNPAAKHTTFRKYDRFLRGYFETYTDGPLDVVSLFREPEDWLRSWWRYRSREDLADPSRSARGWTFTQFVGAYLSGRSGPASVGSQARFVSARDGSIGCDRIFRFDALPAFAGWLSERIEADITLERLNPSPATDQDAALDDEVRAMLQTGLQREYQIYREIAE